MIPLILKKQFKKLRRWRQNKTVVLAVSAVVISIVAIGYANYMENRRLTVNPTTYSQLLTLIAKAESNGNYNAYFGNADNNTINFTDMSVAQVMVWQAEYLQKGNPSNAVGRYQLLSTTLDGLVQRLNINTSQKFDAKLQDTLAIALLERRGAERYINKELSRDQFAANLAMEWAALPKVIGENPGDSYYAGDGLNKSRISVDEVQKAIQPISPK